MHNVCAATACHSHHHGMQGERPKSDEPVVRRLDSCAIAFHSQIATPMRSHTVQGYTDNDRSSRVWPICRTMRFNVGRRTKHVHLRGAVTSTRAPRVSIVPRVASVDRPVSVVPKGEPEEPLPVLEDPWEDAKWTKYKWTGASPQNPSTPCALPRCNSTGTHCPQTKHSFSPAPDAIMHTHVECVWVAVYRGVAYDLTKFVDKHPAGSWLINLSLGRDCTALFESYHLRPDVAVARLKTLPTLPDFPVAAVPQAPRPNDSDLYNTIRERVRTEVFKGQV